MIAETIPPFRPFEREDIEQSLASRFARTVREFPDRPAVHTRGALWTYRELDERAGRVAAALLARAGAGPGRAALLFQHDEAMVAGVVGTVRAGKCYVPLDAAYPVERLRLMLEDAEAEALVTQRQHRELARELAGDGLPVFFVEDLLATGGPAPEPVVIDPRQPAYILYTSGSTGRPKGVAQTHRNMLHHMRNWTNGLEIGPADRLSLQSAYSWDSAVQDTWGALLNGATLCPVGVKQEGIGGVLDWLETARVTVYHSTLPLFRAVTRALVERGGRLPHVRALALGGDFIYASDVELFRAHYEPHCRLFNCYGATESSSALLNRCDRETVVESNVLPLGFPALDTEVFLTDDDGRRVEGEGEGEIVLLSEFIAPGYWRSGEADPRFGPDPEGRGRQTYRTGDLGRRLADGSIRLLGRKDFQVKIDGMRVELGEVEGALKALPKVREAVVLAREDEPGERYLVAYVVLAGEEGSHVEELRAVLRETLPDHAVPAVYVFLDELPLTVNSKIDRLALPAPQRDREQLAAPYVPPHTLLERLLEEEWRAVLHLPKIGLDDNFFDLGGTSLRLASLAERLERPLPGVRAVDLYQYPTIRALVRHLEAAGAVPSRRERRGSAALGSGDRRVAIVGLSCRLPGARDVRAFWENLCGGVESIRPLPDDELRRHGVGEETLSDRNYVKAASVVDGADLFDASFFYLSAREAQKMDPQLRLFLEGAWQALESSGYDSERFEGSIGVFAGSLLSTYLLQLYADPAGHGADIQRFLRDMTARIGNDSNYLATRASYHLNLTGPSVSVQTACSTSLAAVHLAAQSLLAGECDLALAGGVSIRFPQELGYFYEPDGIVSPDGRCRPFDARARGTVFGNGMGVVVLKRYAEAVADGDDIWAVLLSSAAGNDGAGRVGYAAPGVSGQRRVLAEAVAAAGIDPDTVTYVEAHGTGTAMGDPIEFEALSQVYPAGSAGPGSCVLGSVKGNVGHLSVAAGVIGLIKTALMLRHGRIPPTLHFEEWNPRCDASVSRFEINRELREWPSGGPRRAAVSSFGMGGTNVHMVLEEAPPQRPWGASRPYSVLPLSAKSPAALEVARQRAVEFLREHPEVPLADVAHTYALGRRTFNHRCLVTAADSERAAHALDTRDVQTVLEGTGQPAPRPVVFLFPGQGAQRARMGADAYEHEPVFRRAVDECAELLRPELGFDLRDVLYPDLRGIAGPADNLERTELAQPALFVVEYALARLWESWGVRPDAMAGHSVGEYVAACLAGVFELPDALRLVAARGRLIQDLPRGAMAAVPLPPGALAGRLIDGVSIAAVNEPGVCTISGAKDLVSEMVDRLADEGVQAREVHTSHAFHSVMMEPARERLAEIVRGVRCGPVRIPFLSNLTGTWITEAQAHDPEYWARHLREPVRFADSISELLKDESWVFLEVGPGQTLSTFVRRHPDRPTGQPVFSSFGRTRTKGADHAHLITTLGRFWLAGLEVDWKGFYRHEERRRLSLPTYPFESIRYRLEPQGAVTTAARGTVERGKLDLDHWMYVPVWRQSATPAVAAPPSREANGEPRRWLLFEDACGIAAGLARRLEDRGAEVTRVGPGAPEAVAALVRELAGSGRLPHRIVHALSVTPGEEGERSAGKFEAAQRDGFYSLVALAQALATENVTRPMRIDVLTSNAEPVLGDEPLAAEKATAQVAAWVISQELAHVRCHNVDLPTPPPPGPALDRLLSQLERELGDEVEREIGVAFRGPYRWVKGYERLEGTAEQPGAQRLRQGATYLITGGLGEIGSTFAEMLHRHYEARLALLVRDPVPPREEWESRVEADPEGEETLRLRRALRLESLGARFVVVNADVADPVALAAAFEQAEAEVGEISGVIHAAGLPSEKWDRTLRDTTPEICGAHFRAKAHGQIALERVLASRRVDFCLLVSSLAGVLGGLRLAPYGAANRFLDAAAWRANADGGITRWVSVDWDVWQHHQDEKRALSGIGRVMDDKAIQPEEGIEVLRRVLALGEASQVAVSTWSLDLRLDPWLLQRKPKTEKRAAGAAPAAAAPGGAGPGRDGTAPRTRIEQEVSTLLANALGAETIGMTDDLFELGGDSLMLVRVLSEIRDQYDLVIPLADVLNEPTAAALSALVERPRGRRDAADLFRELASLPAEDMLALLTEVESLSPDQVAAALRA